MKAVLTAALIVAALACADAQSAPATQSQAASPQPDAVVAEVAGRAITLKELDDKWQSFDPAERARVIQMLYQNRRNVLDIMVGDALIEQAAKAAGATTREYLETETAKRLKPVTDADVQRFFEENKDRAQGRSVDQLREPIREFLGSQRQQQARAQLVDDLKTANASTVRVLLEAPRVEVAVSADDPVRGNPTAAITIIEYSDYQCPFCARVNPTLDQIRSTYGDKVRIVFKDFPLPNHPEAPKAAEAAHCAGDQGKYWEMHDRLFGNQRALGLPTLKQHAVDLKLDTAAFNQCLDSGKYGARVADNVRTGEQLGVQSTPTLYINGRPAIGAQSFDYFKAVIDEELARKR